MNISKLNEAVLVELMGFLMFMGTPEPIIRILGIVAVIWGGVLYRKERKRLKAVEASQESAKDESE